MLSTQKSQLKTISLHGNSFNESSEEDKVMIEKHLQELNGNSIVLESLSIYECNLTDDLFLPIVNVLKFFENISLYGNKLTLKSVYYIFKVYSF